METTTINPYPISNSRLNVFKDSPKHLIHYLTNRPEPTVAMKFGTAFHMKLLQPNLFNQMYVIGPSVDRRSKTGKEIWDQFISSAENISRQIITTDESDKIDDMIESVMNNPTAADLINNLIERELDLIWTDSDSGLPMRGIIDGVGLDYMIDIKTCASGKPHKFQRDAINMNYHQQAAIYMDSMDNEIRDFYIIAIEKDEPYGVSIHRISDELLDIGRKQYRKLLNEYQTWVEIGMPVSDYDYWNVTGVYDFDAPNWMKLNDYGV